SADARRLASSALSLPLEAAVEFCSLTRFSGVSCAVRPFGVTRYVVVTLSDWSWSTTEKSRTVGQGLASAAVPRSGTFSLAAWIAAFACWKNAGALQNEN